MLSRVGAQGHRRRANPRTRGRPRSSVRVARVNPACADDSGDPEALLASGPCPTIEPSSRISSASSPRSAANQNGRSNRSTPPQSAVRSMVTPARSRSRCSTWVATCARGSRPPRRAWLERARVDARVADRCGSRQDGPHPRRASLGVACARAVGCPHGISPGPDHADCPRPGGSRRMEDDLDPPRRHRAAARGHGRRTGRYTLTSPGRSGRGSRRSRPPSATLLRFAR